MVRKSLAFIVLGVICFPSVLNAQAVCNERKLCGGILGISCEKGYECVPVSDSSCDPKSGGSDCQGVCAVTPVTAAQCIYGDIVTPSPTAFGKAKTQLSQLSPSASMGWNRTTGTFQSVNALDVEVRDCASSRQVFNLLSQQLFAPYRGLFQISPSEWSSNNVTCGSVPENQTAVLRLDRYKMGRQLHVGDYMLIYLTRRNGKVFVSSITARYFPMLTRQQDADFAACQDLSPGQAQRSLSRHAFTFSVLNRCAVRAAGLYTPNSNDSIRFDSERLGICADSYWTWTESADKTGVSFRKSQRGVLQIGAANVDEKILSSDLNCPVYGSTTERIFGFEMEWDALTGEILLSRPGIGCTVC